MRIRFRNFYMAEGKVVCVKFMRGGSNWFDFDCFWMWLRKNCCSRNWLLSDNDNRRWNLFDGFSEFWRLLRGIFDPKRTDSIEKSLMVDIERFPTSNDDKNEVLNVKSYKKNQIFFNSIKNFKSNLCTCPWSTFFNEKT